MGYRSDVAYTIRFKDVDTMTLFITEAKTKGLQAALNECDIRQDKHLDRCRINFVVGSYKWYDSYDEVKAHTALIALARDWCETDRHEYARRMGDDTYITGDGYKLGFIFVRVGEDLSDCEEDCDGDSDWDWLRVERRVVTDWE